VLEHFWRLPESRNYIHLLNILVSTPTVWKSLSGNCKEAELVSSFRSRLKTELFYGTPLVYRQDVPLIRLQRKALCISVFDFS